MSGGQAMSPEDQELFGRLGQALTPDAPAMAVGAAAMAPLPGLRTAVLARQLAVGPLPRTAQLAARRDHRWHGRSRGCRRGDRDPDARATKLSSPLSHHPFDRPRLDPSGARPVRRRLVVGLRTGLANGFGTRLRTRRDRRRSSWGTLGFGASDRRTCPRSHHRRPRRSDLGLEPGDRSPVEQGRGRGRPYTWSASGLPSGLSIDTHNGTITGTPTVTCSCS